ncbi:KDEL motif-containing protein 1 [Porphyridium purpureum]|uniref:KDEL motif-containing protein 1 n=1 Tax=Porphyridium purpureum TaxID=35688 RepID=A0A5J4YYS5_PORPP|nr:KDEL motif-containing protein 1 [Porphyridium purpureum]|eukprot:POR6722..scf209_3
MKKSGAKSSSSSSTSAAAITSASKKLGVASDSARDQKRAPREQEGSSAKSSKKNADRKGPASSAAKSSSSLSSSVSKTTPAQTSVQKKRTGHKVHRREEQADLAVPMPWNPKFGWAFVTACIIVSFSLLVYSHMAKIIPHVSSSSDAKTITGDRLRANPEAEWSKNTRPQDGRVEGRVPQWYPWSHEERRKEFARVLDDFFSTAELSAFSVKAQESALEDSNSLSERVVLVRITPNHTVEYMRKWEPENKHTRFESLRGLMEALVHKYKMKPVSFLVTLNDAASTGKIAAFSSIRQSKHHRNTIPFPIGNSRGQPLGYGLNFTGWDGYAYNNYLSKHSDYPWMRKNSRAVFRGNYHMSQQLMASCWDTCVKSTDWTKMSRGAMYKIAQKRPDLFDVKFTSKGPKDSPYFENVPVDPDAKLKLVEFQAYKVVLSVGANADWAERVRNLLFLNSALMKHDVKLQEWFYLLMQPFVHYIPVKEDMSDLIEQQQWAVDHDRDVEQIAANGVEFAQNVLSEAAMLEFAHMAILRFARRQKAADAPRMSSLPTPLPKRF